MYLARHTRNKQSFFEPCAKIIKEHVLLVRKSRCTMLLCNRCANVLWRTSGYPTAVVNSTKVLPWLQTCLPRRYATSWKKRLIRQEQLKDVVFQYATKNTKKTDRVYVWGYAGTGALGVERFLKPEKHQGPRVKQLAPHRLDFFTSQGLRVVRAGAGYGFTVFVCQTADKRDVVYGCGINTDSQLGYQEYPRNSGRLLDFVVSPASIDLPLASPDTTRVTDVACGRAHTLVLTDTEGVFSLGHNAYGQCGRSIVEDEIYRGSQIINKVNFEEKIAKVFCGQDHSLFLSEGGAVYSCGLGADGQTGQGHNNIISTPIKVTGDIEGERIVSMATKADCVLAVSDQGELFGWGNSEYGQLSVVSGDETQVTRSRHLTFAEVGKVVKVAAAGSLCALLNDRGDVYMWGYGILGKGPDLEHSATPQLIPPTLFGRNELNPEQRVVDIAAGISHLAAITESGDLYMWGRNRESCLGLGNTTDHYFPFKVHVPAEVHSVSCGVDHTIAVCKSFT